VIAFRLTALAGVLLIVSSGSAAAQSFAFERSFQAGPAVTIDVTTIRGKITVRTGATDDQVRVSGEAVVRTGFNVPVNARDLARATADKPPIEQNGAVIRMRPPSDPMVRAAVTVAYEIEVPARATVLAVTDSGAVSITHIDGAVTVKTTSAAISLANLGGPVTVDTGSGDVSLTGVKKLATVTTKSSRIVGQDLAGGLIARTGSGQVRASFTGPGDVEVYTQSSAIDLLGVDGGLRVVSGSGQVTVSGAPRTPWSVSTTSSAIEISFSGDASATVDASSQSSSVKSDPGLLEGPSGPRRVSGKLNGGGPAVTVTSRSGAIVLRGRIPGVFKTAGIPSCSPCPSW
jgi:hypothetical protein